VKVVFATVGSGVKQRQSNLRSNFQGGSSLAKLEPVSICGKLTAVNPTLDTGSSLWPEVCGIKTAIVQVAMHLQHGHKARMSGPPAQHGLQAARKNIMKNKRSWWSLKIHDYPNYDPNDSDLEHIAECIRQGYDQGELIQDEEN